MSAPFVTAVVPSYNHARYVEGAVRSVLDQRGLDRPLEVVVVDDGSRDASPELLRRLASEDARIRLELRANRGISATFNRGLELARGEWVAYCCSDDRWHPDHLARAFAALAQDPAAVVSYGRARLVDADDRVRTDEQLFVEDLTEREPLRRLLREGNGLCFVGAVFRRAAALEAGGFDPELVVLQDYDLWLKLARAGAAVHVLEPTVDFRWDGANASGPRATVQKRLDAIRVLERALETFPELRDDHALRESVVRRLIKSHVRVARRLPRARRREHLQAARRLGLPRLEHWLELARGLL